MARGDPSDVELFQQNLRLKHAAIIQYLQHAWRIPEGEVRCELEEIAREEMRHYRWLAQTVAAFGGDPTVERGPLRLDGETLSDLMQIDAADEAASLARSREQAAGVADPKAREVLNRIAQDEAVHQQAFEKFAREVVGLEDLGRRQPTPEQAVVIEVLNRDISLEYMTIVQYLHQSFVTDRARLADMLSQDQAQESMKHMGWLGELVAALGGRPTTGHDPVNLSDDLVEMLESDTAAEREAERVYTEQVGLVDEPGVRALLDRIRLQEVAHASDFEEELARVRRERAGPDGIPSPLGRLTVGSLLGKPQSRTED